MKHNSTVLIIDFGSQFTQLIARRIREIGIYAQIVPHTIKMSEFKAFNVSALILSGGPMSVYDSDSPSLSFSLNDVSVPILGICYGLQYICKEFGGDVTAADVPEYGKAEINIENNSKLLADVENKSIVWMSHGDSINSLPSGFTIAAKTNDTPNAVIENIEKSIFGVQFHPEVAHTTQGTKILYNFLIGICKIAPDWNANSFIAEVQNDLLNNVSDGNIICALSGGVDSTVAAVLIDSVFRERLFCIHIDNGLMRKDESKKVVEKFREQFNLNLIHVDASELFLNNLKGVSDPEKKRKIIGKTFIDVFEEEAKKIPNVKYLVQGTLYPDVIESVSVKGSSVTIKSHHNVGGLPEKMNLKLIEPLRELFKDEVRRVGETLGIEREFLYRHPFPGPGLGVRILGEITKDKLDVLREADDIYISELRNSGLYNHIWQAFAVLLPINTVGVMGDARTYENVLALRAVTSTDGMTADWFRFPNDFLAEVSLKISNKVKGVNRVVYDISSKPPATIEWE